jgi:hypothetical protein
MHHFPFPHFLVCAFLPLPEEALDRKMGEKKMLHNLNYAVLASVEKIYLQKLETA